MIALLLFVLGLVSAETTYIVVFEDDMEIDELHNHITETLGGLEQAQYIYRHALKGYAAPLTPGAYVKVMKHPKFKSIERDQLVHASKTEQTCTQATALSWGLTRISQRDMDLNGLYKYPTNAGEGVWAYIIDTGILITHEDFQGRAQFGFKASSSWSSDDKNGHGTHVASTVGGVTYGVAKKVTLVAVKVLGDDGSGTNAGVIAGVDWAYGSHQARGSKKSVANMSLGGGYSGALNTAVTSAMKGGLFMVVAAGNENADACNGSPSSAKDVITVGATEQGFPTGDVRSYFSNYGVCVDIFAPGTEITAAWIGNTNRVIKTISGTSMASPHVCGVAALITAADPNAHWAQVATHLLGRGTQNKIQFECSSSACKASPNIMLFNNC